MSAAIEYHGYQVEVTVEEQDWGFAVGQWRGSFRFWKEGGLPPQSCTISRTEKSAYDARQKTLRIAMSFINAEIAMEKELFDMSTNVLARHRVVTCEYRK